jgi:DNA-binding response OmpR family regulator
MSQTILIVDDEPDIVFVTERFLKVGGYKTLTCNNGKEALKLIEDRYDEITLTLLDVMMPGVSGFDVLRTIKNDDRYKTIKVVLFTVKSFKEDVQKGTNLGADGYITKPFKGEDLLDYVKKLLDKN